MGGKLSLVPVWLGLTALFIGLITNQIHWREFSWILCVGAVVLLFILFNFVMNLLQRNYSTTYSPETHFSSPYLDTEKFTRDGGNIEVRIGKNGEKHVKLSRGGMNVVVSQYSTRWKVDYTDQYGRPLRHIATTTDGKTVADWLKKIFE